MIKAGDKVLVKGPLKVVAVNNPINPLSPKTVTVEIRIRDTYGTEEVGEVEFPRSAVIEYKSKQKKDIVQIYNPSNKLYTKVDRGRGRVLGHKKTQGPFKNIPIVKNISK